MLTPKFSSDNFVACRSRCCSRCVHTLRVHYFDIYNFGLFNIKMRIFVLGTFLLKNTKKLKQVISPKRKFHHEPSEGLGKARLPWPSKSSPYQLRGGRGSHSLARGSLAFLPLLVLVPQCVFVLLGCLSFLSLLASVSLFPLPLTLLDSWATAWEGYGFCAWTHFLAFMEWVDISSGPAAWSYVPVQSSSCSLRVFYRTLVVGKDTN